jgi:hypothetical protein
VNVSTISAGAQVMCVGLLVGMGDVATKEAFEWAIGNTNAIRASAEVSRFKDDMADFKVFCQKVVLRILEGMLLIYRVYSN